MRTTWCLGQRRYGSYSSEQPCLAGLVTQYIARRDIMSVHKRKYRHKHKKNQDTIRAWRVWENGTSRFGALVVALKEHSAEVYRQATGQEYNGPDPFDILLFATDRDSLLEWAERHRPHQESESGS